MPIFILMSFWILFFYTVYFSEAGVIRHGINKNESIKLAQAPAYDCVGMFTQNGQIKGSCVLIHPRIALTAAHTLIKVNELALEIEFDSIRVKIDSFLLHPWYLKHKAADIAILYLSQSISSVTLPTLNNSKKEINQVGTSVGYGNFSVANNPRDIVDAGRVKSAGKNNIDSITRNYLPNKSQPLMYADFDNPYSGKLNKSGDTMALDMEYGLDGGDSGGGMFINSKNKEVLAGINAIQNKNVGEILRTGAFYGSSSEWIRISVFRKWIRKEMKLYKKSLSSIKF